MRTMTTRILVLLSAALLCFAALTEEDRTDNSDGAIVGREALAGQGVYSFGSQEVTLPDNAREQVCRARLAACLGPQAADRVTSPFSCVALCAEQADTEQLGASCGHDKNQCVELCSDMFSPSRSCLPERHFNTEM